MTTRYTTASTFHVAFPTAIELLQLPLVDNYTPACTTLQNIFHHHQLLKSTSCSIVPSPTSKHNEIHVWAFTIASTHHFASAMQSAHHHHPANTTATGIDNCFHCYDTTTDYMLFTQQAQHLAVQVQFPHSTTAISTGSPSSLTSVKYTPPQINYPMPACFPKYTTKPTPCLTTPQFTTPQINYPAGLTSVKYTTKPTPCLLPVSSPPHRSTIPCRLDFRKIHYKAYPLSDYPSVHHPTDQLSPAGLTSVKYTT